MDTEENSTESILVEPIQFRVKHLLEGTAWLAVLLAIVVNTRESVGIAVLLVAVWNALLLASLYVRDHMRGLTACGLWFGITWLSCGGIPQFQLPQYGHSGARCNSNMGQIGLALQQYELDYGVLPPAFIADAGGKPMHSWRVLILPYLGESNIYAQYNFSEPWDGPNNRMLHSIIMRPYRCLSDNGILLHTSYVAVVGPGAIWDNRQGTVSKTVRDDPASTVMLVEVANSGIHWMEPRDLSLAAAASGNNPPTSPSISSNHGRCANVVMRNGDASRLDVRTPANTLHALSTVAGDELLVKENDDQWSLGSSTAGGQE
jgi:hypothetical protein